MLAASVSEFPIRAQGGGSLDVTTGPDGNLWFSMASNNIGMMNPATQVSAQYPIPTINSGAGDITTGPDGKLWFVETNAGQIAALNPASGIVTEFPILSTANAQPQGITKGPDGNLWFTELNANQIGAINPTTHAISEYRLPTSNAQPFGIVTGPDGNLWFTESGANQVGMINPATHAIQEFTVPASGNVQAEGIVAGPDGNLWFTETAADKVGMINPATHAVNSFTLPTGNAQPEGITKGPDGNLWFAELKGSGTATGAIGVINPTSHAIAEYSGMSFNSAPQAIVAAPDGNLWFTETNLSSLGRIIPSTHTVKEFGYKKTTTGNLNTITAGPDGNVWFIQSSDGQIGFMNPSTHFTTQFKLPTLYNTAPAIVTGPDQNVWFTEDEFSSDKIGRIIPATGTISEFTLPTANGAPGGIAPGSDNNLWFTENVANKIGRITTAGAIAEFSIPTASAGPLDIVGGSDGNLWFTEQSAGKIGTINVTSHAVQEFPLSGGTFSRPTSIVAGPDGNLWFIEADLIHGVKIATINPTSHAIQEYPVSAGTPLDLTVGPDQNLWFSAAGLVGTMNATTHAITTFNVVNANPQSVATGPDGNLWFTANGTFNGTAYNPNVLGAVVLSPPSVGTQLAITSQPSGSVAAGRGFGLVVAVENSTGQLAPDYTGTVTVALANNPGGATLGGTLTATASNGVAFFPGLTLDKGGTGYKLLATATGLTSATSSAFNVSLPATHLVVTAQPPSGLIAGGSFGLIVAAEDPLGNVDTNFSGNVGIAIGTNAGGGTLSGVMTVATNAGLATFSGLSLNRSGSGYTLQASSSGLTGATTGAFNVSAAPATQLVVANQPPGTIVAGTGFGLTISAEDSFGNVDKNFTGNVALAIANNAGNGTLGGTLGIVAGAGSAAFSGLSLDKAAGGYTLQATSPGLSPAVTAPFTVTAAAAAQLVVTTQPPATVAAGKGFGVVVMAEDTFGNVDPSFHGNVTVALDSNPGAATLGGLSTVPAGSGVASFFGLTLNAGGKGYTLQATAAGLGSAITSAFNVRLPASQLVVTTEPPLGVVAGKAFGLTVSAEDAFGIVDPTFAGDITLAIGNNPGDSTVTGLLTVTASGGSASFSGLTLNKSGTGYTLQASSPGLASGLSTAFTVLAAQATQLAVTTLPPSVVTAGTSFGLAVSAEDAFGNISTGFTGAMTVSLANNPGGTALAGTLIQTAAGGTATFSGLMLNRAAGGYTLQVSCAGLPAVITGAFAVAAAAASQLVVTTQPPANVAPGVGFGLIVSARDAFGNLATSFPGAITIALGANPGGSTLSGNLSLSAINGAVSFAGLALNRSGRGYTLQASAAGLPTVTTSAFNVSAASGDNDGDGKADLGFYSASTATFVMVPSSGAKPAVFTNFGGPGWRATSGDYDGDGKTDVGLYNAAAGTFVILPSHGGNAIVMTGLGGPGAQPLSGDYDGDGKTDFGYYNPNTATFAMVPSGGGKPINITKFGGPGFQALSGDYDGDGKRDIGLFSNGAFLIIPSRGGKPIVITNFGTPGSQPLSGDYDGDGKTDFGYYSAGTGLFISIPSGGGTPTVLNKFGGPGFQALSGDYDGDGKTDIGLYGNSTFIIIPSHGGKPMVIPNFGPAGSQPLGACAASGVSGQSVTASRGQGSVSGPAGYVSASRVQSSARWWGTPVPSSPDEPASRRAPRRR